MKISPFCGIQKSFLEDLTTIGKAAQSSCAASRVVILKNEDGGVQKAWCNYHFFQLLMCLFTKIVSCFFSTRFKQQNMSTANWLIENFGEKRLRRISDRYNLGLFDLVRDNGLPLQKRDLRVIFSALSVVTKTDIQEVFDNIKKGNEPNYLNADAREQLAARFADKEFAQLSSEDIDDLVSIANPFSSLDEKKKKALFLNNPPKYSSPGYDRGKSGDGIVNLANEMQHMHQTYFVDNQGSADPDMEACFFIKKCAGWYNPEGMLVKFADGWRSLEGHVAGGGQFKTFFHTIGRDAGSSHAPNLMFELPTQAMGPAPHAWLSIEADFSKEVGAKGFVQSYQSTREALKEAPGMWRGIGYSLGGTGICNDYLADLCHKESERKFNDILVIANPGVSNESAAAFVDVTNAIRGKKAKITYIHHYDDLTCGIGDRHLGYMAHPSKVEIIHKMYSPKGGWGDIIPYNRIFRAANPFRNLDELYDSVMRGAHNAVPHGKNYEVQVLTNQDSKHLRTLNKAHLDNIHLGFNLDTKRCSLGSKGIVVGDIRKRKLPMARHIDLSAGVSGYRHEADDNLMNPKCVDDVFRVHAARIGIASAAA